MNWEERVFLWGKGVGIYCSTFIQLLNDSLKIMVYCGLLLLEQSQLTLTYSKLSLRLIQFSLSSKHFNTNSCRLHVDYKTKYKLISHTCTAVGKMSYIQMCPILCDSNGKGHLCNSFAKQVLVSCCFSGMQGLCSNCLIIMFSQLTCNFFF